MRLGVCCQFVDKSSVCVCVAGLGDGGRHGRFTETGQVSLDQSRSDDSALCPTRHLHKQLLLCLTAAAARRVIVVRTSQLLPFRLTADRGRGRGLAARAKRHRKRGLAPRRCTLTAYLRFKQVVSGAVKEGLMMSWLVMSLPADVIDGVGTTLDLLIIDLLNASAVTVRPPKQGIAKLTASSLMV